MGGPKVFWGRGNGWVLQDGHRNLTPEAQQLFEFIVGPVLAGKRLESVVLRMRALGGVVGGPPFVDSSLCFRDTEAVFVSMPQEEPAGFLGCWPVAGMALIHST